MCNNFKTLHNHDLLISFLFVWDADFFPSLLLLLKPLLELFFWLITLWAIWKCRGESMLKRRLSMLLKLLTTASSWSWYVKKQWLGIIFLWSCKPICNWTRFVYCREWQVLISMKVNTERECCWWGSSFLCNDWMGNQIALGCYGWRA